MRAEAKKPIKSRKTGAKLYASTASRRQEELLSSPRDKLHTLQGLYKITSPEAELSVSGDFYALYYKKDAKPVLTGCLALNTPVYRLDAVFLKEAVCP